MMPLAVMLRTAMENLRSGWGVDLYVLDGGISASNKKILKDSVAEFDVSITWVQFDFSAVKEFMISHHVSHVAYYRLMIADALPTKLDKVLYIDCDMLVRDDIVKIWEKDLDEQYCLAVPDIACPFVFAQAHPETKNSWPYLASINPIKNFKQLGIEEKQRYFNSGLMYINLKRWRDEYLSTQFLTCLEENHKFIWCWDQYALNVVMAGQWGKLEMKWNQGLHVYEFPSIVHGPIPANEFEEFRENPSIIHFTTEHKPWHYGATGRNVDMFFEALDRTAWKDWRPGKPDFKFRYWMDQNMGNIVKHAGRTYRKVASILT